MINFKIDISDNLTRFKSTYELWLLEKGYDLNYVKYLTAIIFLNMSPLHDGKFSQILWFKSLEMFANVN